MQKGILIFLLALGFGMQGCFNPNDYVNPNPNGIIQITSIDTTVSADGISMAIVKVSISNKADDSRRNVVFKTSIGNFVGGKGDSIIVKAGSDFVSSANLVSTKSGKAMVSAKILSVTAAKTEQVTFTQAYPQSVKVSVDSFAIRNKFPSELTIMASLKTNNGGVASSGQTVTFSVVELSTRLPIGFFLNNINTVKSDAQGNASIRYSAGNANSTGYLIITASAFNAFGAPQSDSTRVFLTN